MAVNFDATARWWKGGAVKLRPLGAMVLSGFLKTFSIATWHLVNIKGGQHGKGVQNDRRRECDWPAWPSQHVELFDLVDPADS